MTDIKPRYALKQDEKLTVAWANLALAVKDKKKKDWALASMHYGRGIDYLNVRGWGRLHRVAVGDGMALGSPYSWTMCGVALRMCMCMWLHAPCPRERADVVPRAGCQRERGVS